MTGKKRPSAQLRWCAANGVRAWMSGRGEVIVPVSAVDGRRAAANEAVWAPDYSALKG